jgi:hypothetical protein
MAFLKMMVPEWVQAEIDKKQQAQNIPQQRTIMPQSVFMGGQPSGLRGPQRPQPNAMPEDYSNRTDHVPATLRNGEEVIPPEIIKAMGGRDAFIQHMNQRLPQGLSMTGGRGPVKGGDAENSPIDGTLRLAQSSPFAPQQSMPQPTPTGMEQATMPPEGAEQPQGMAFGGSVGVKQYRGGYARGTTGLSFRSRLAKGTPQVSTEGAYYPGAITLNNRDKPIGSLPGPTMRRGFAAGTPQPDPNTTPKPAITPPTQASPTQPNTTAQLTATTTLQPPAATVPDATTGKGMSAVPFTQSTAYKLPAKAATETLQKQNAVQNATLAQNQAQAGVAPTSAQARTAAAEQTATQGSQIAATQSQIAQNAQAQIQQQMNQSMQLAYQSGDWGAVNKVLTQSGAPPVDFTNLENQRKAGNLGAMSQTLLTLSQSITGTDTASVATKAALAQEATGMISTQAKTLLGSQFDPGQMSAAIANIEAGQTTDPVTQAFVQHVATVPAQWATNTVAGSGFTDGLQNTPAGQQLMSRAEAGDTQAIQTLAHLTTLAMTNFYNQGTGLSSANQALLNQYGVYTDWSKVSAEDRAYQEGPLSGATSFSYGLSPMSSSNNPSMIQT